MSRFSPGRFGTLILILCVNFPVLATAQFDDDDFTSPHSGAALSGMASAGFLNELATIDEPTRQSARRGEAFFNTAFVPAPSAATLRDGLGPLFNAAACGNCHSQRGRRERSRESLPLPAMQVLQLSELQADGRWLAHRAYGENLNPAATPGIPAEGWVSIAWEKQTVFAGGGSTLTRSRPLLQFHDLAYGVLDQKAVAWSLRTAQPLFGMGLLESVADESILALADPDDGNNDGISGRGNWIPHPSGLRLGRFGWKANHATLRDQIVAALLNEQGVTSPDRPTENCTAIQSQCRSAGSGGVPEIAEQDLEAVVLFNRLFPVPARHNPHDERVGRGAAQFTVAGCHQCHHPTMTTAKHPIPALSQQRIHPYTDLLLHDMGPGLADNRPDHQASGNEWRTAPLWGLGLARTMGLPVCYLHDCRAETFEEAILWHGGEGERSRSAYLAMTMEQRNLLLTFLYSL